MNIIMLIKYSLEVGGVDDCVVLGYISLLFSRRFPPSVDTHHAHPSDYTQRCRRSIYNGNITKEVKKVEGLLFLHLDKLNYLISSLVNSIENSTQDRSFSLGQNEEQ